MTESDYIVLRQSPDLPAGFLPPRLDGVWFDRASFRSSAQADRDGLADAAEGGVVAVPTGRFEVRDDGAVAEVWEFQP